MPEWTVHHVGRLEEEMTHRNAIGIDPDSKGLQCALIKPGTPHLQQKTFLATEKGNEEFHSMGENPE